LGVEAACALRDTTRDMWRAESCLSRCSPQVFDAGAAFEVQQLRDGTRRAVCIAPDGLAPAQDVFLARLQRKAAPFKARR